MRKNKAVYIVEESYDYEGSSLISVHQTLEGAKRRASLEVSKDRSNDWREAEQGTPSTGLIVWSNGSRHLVITSTLLED